jgi:pimeloyl-ACP methyl ester carboxylesterase
MYPAGEPGITARYVSLSDGTAIRVVESGNAGADSGILLVHGWGGSVYTYKEMIPALVAAGHRVVAFDLPGHGLSAKPTDENRYRTDALAGVVIEVARLCGLRRFSCVGHSMGASLVLHLACRGEPGLERIVLVGPAGIGRVPVIAPLRLLSPRVIDRFMPRLLLRVSFALLLRVAYGTDGRPTQRDVDEYWAPSQFDEFAVACRASIHKTTWTPQPDETLRGLTIPTLVVSGGRDRIVRGAPVRARLIPGGRLLFVPEGGHLVLQECSDQTNAEVVDFLRRGAKPLS